MRYKLSWGQLTPDSELLSDSDSDYYGHLEYSEYSDLYTGNTMDQDLHDQDDKGACEQIVNKISISLYLRKFTSFISSYLRS